MSLLLDIEQNLPPPIIAGISASLSVPLSRVGNFYRKKTGSGCGTTCIWNGGGYYMDQFVCGQTYPSRLTFYCCADCHNKVGESKKVFLSYRWCDAEIADKISSCARGAGIDIIRDVNKMGFLHAISSFMTTAGESRYFVAVMTESYFYSRFCMYEFCELVESAQSIRTIPVLLGTAVEPGIECKLKEYWRDKHQDLNQAIRGIDERHAGYLRPELDLLARIPRHIDDFYAQWRLKERPEGKRWLIANCRYLVGAIKTTFKPTADDASNWTYSNKTVRGEVAPDAPRAAIWERRPFYLHSHSEAESLQVARSPRARDLLLRVYHNGALRGTPPRGVHLVLINNLALGSLAFCRLLQRLMDRADVTVVPIFLDEALRMPTAEVGLLRQWHERLEDSADSKVRKQIDSMLCRFGAMVERLRDALTPSLDVVLEACH